MNYQGRTGIYFNRVLSSTLTETVIVVDTVSRTIGRAFDDIVTVVDGISYTTLKVADLSEIITVADTLTRTFARAFVEVVTVVATLATALLGRAIGFMVGKNKNTGTGIGTRLK